MNRVSLLPENRQGEDRATPIVLRPSLEATWAIVCGLVAAGYFRWDGSHALAIVATWLVVDAVLGCVFEQLVALKRTGWQQIVSDDDTDPPLVHLPYAAPASPGRRLIRQVSAYARHWRDQIWPTSGRHGVTALFCTGLALIVTTYLGRIMLAAASVGLLLAALMAILAQSNADALERWLSGLHVTLAWSMAGLIVGSWSAVSFGLALLAGLGTYARVWVYTGPNNSATAARFLRIVWWCLVLILLLAKQPILAMVVAVAALAERARDGQLPVIGRMGWLAAILVAALAANYWI
ncbi:MAG: hypothetical protein ACOX9A_04185 [Anaerolineae bacterium]